MANESLKLSGEIPQIHLFRFFSVRDYADQFVHGNLRFGWQKKYASMEGDIREDTTEGTASFTVNGNSPGEVIESGSISGWESYILCASEVDCAFKLRILSERFSNPEDTSGYFVEIRNLTRFTEEVAEALQKSPYWDAIDYIYWKKVEYNKFEHLGDGPPNVELHSYQKPAHISTYTYTNKCTGKTCTLGSTHMFMSNEAELAMKYFPSTEWERSETQHDYTVESEWRLVVSIKMRFKVEQLNIPMLVTGSEREARICAHLKINREQLTNYSTGEIERLVPDSNFWIDTLEASNRNGFDSFLKVEKIKFNRFSCIYLAIKQMKMYFLGLSVNRT